MRLVFLPLLFIHLFCMTLQAQNRTSDTSATCIAFWEKGDHKIFEVTHTKQKTEAGKIISSNIITYEAHLKVLEATENGYTLEWSHLNYKPAQADAQTTKAINALMGQLKFKYKTDDAGAFLELLNWQEVRDFYVKLLEVSIHKDKDEATTAAINKTLQLFQTKESVEAVMIKEIQLYHAPFGIEYDFRGQQLETLLPNFTGGAPFPANISLKLADLSPSKDAATIHFTQSIDKGKAATQIAQVLKQLVPEAEQHSGFDAALFSSLEQADVSEFVLTLSTGWLAQAVVKRTTQIGNQSQMETYEIIAKKN